MCNFFSVLHPPVGINFYALWGLNPLRCVSHVLLCHRSEGDTEIQSQESDDDGTVSTVSVDSTEDSVEEARDASTAIDSVPKLKRAVEQSTVCH